MGFGVEEFELVFEAGDDFVDALHGEMVGEGAVAGDLEVVSGAADVDFVDVEDFGEVAGSSAQGGGDAFGLASAVAGLLDGDGALDGGWLGLDVGENAGELGNFAEDFGFHGGDEVVSLGEGETLIEFDVLFDAELGPAFAIHDGLDADLVDADVVAGGDGADAVEDAFGGGLAGDGMNDDVRAGDGTLDGFGGFADQFVGVLEGEAAREGEGEVGEGGGAGAADAGLFDGEDALDVADGGEDLLAGFGGGGVEEAKT